MSKLIVDDIELASGDNFSIPDEITPNKLIKVEGNKITAFEDLPAAKYKLIHDFSSGQPEQITYTLSKNSDSLLGFHLIFEGMRFDSNPSNKDIGYDIFTATGVSHHTLNSQNKWHHSVGVYPSTRRGSSDYAAADYRDNEIHMQPHRGNFTTNAQTYSNTWRNLGTFDHYCMFYRVGDLRIWRAMGHYQSTNNDRNADVMWARSAGTSAATWDSNSLTSTTSPSYPSQPYTNLVFNTRESEGFNAHEGKIKILEIDL